MAVILVVFREACPVPHAMTFSMCLNRARGPLDVR